MAAGALLKGLPLRDVRIIGTVDLSNVSTSQEVTCTACVFEGAFIARKAVFRKQLDLTGSRFNGPVDFAGATFLGPVLFGTPASKPSVFAGNAEFASARFEGLASYDGVQFEGAAVFDQAQFLAGASFRLSPYGATKFTPGLRTSFRGRASFRGTSFTGDANFDLADFDGEAHFDEASFLGNANFRLSRFGRDVGFQYSEFSHQPDFSDADFEVATFQGASFASGATFGRATFHRSTDFSLVTSGGTLDFSQAAFEATIDMFELRTTDLVAEPVIASRVDSPPDRLLVLALIEATAKRQQNFSLANDAFYARQTLVSRTYGSIFHALDVVFYRWIAGYLVRPEHPLIAFFALIVLTALASTIRRLISSRRSEKRGGRWQVFRTSSAWLVQRVRIASSAAVRWRTPPASELGTVEVVAYRVLAVCFLIGLYANPTLRQLFDFLRR